MDKTAKCSFIYHRVKPEIDALKQQHSTELGLEPAGQELSRSPSRKRGQRKAEEEKFDLVDIEQRLHPADQMKDIAERLAAVSMSSRIDADLVLEPPTTRLITDPSLNRPRNIFCQEMSLKNDSMLQRLNVSKIRLTDFKNAVTLTPAEFAQTFFGGLVEFGEVRVHNAP